MPQSNLSIAVVCSSNMNRSMEAHAFLSKKGFQVRSFGTGDKVKLPGTAPDRPNVYEFSCTYEEIYQDLLNKDKSFYTQNGLLHMLDRNKRIKTRPERFQQCKDKFDIIVTCEERVYDQVVEYITNRMPTENASVHVINIDIQDNHEEATIGAFLICEMMTHIVSEMKSLSDVPNLYLNMNILSFVCSPAEAQIYKMAKSDDLDNDIDEMLHQYESKCQRQLLHCVLFY